MSQLAINSQMVRTSNRVQVPSRSHLVRIEPETKSKLIQPNTMTTWTIPTKASSGQYVNTSNSYLEFNVTVTNPTDQDCRLDRGAHSLIKEVIVESNSFQVEHTTSWNRLHSVLSDLQQDENATDATQAYLLGLDSADVRKGRTLAGCSGGASVTQRIIMKIPSQFMNLKGEMIPVHKIDNLVYKIIWAPSVEAIAAHHQGGTAAGSEPSFAVNDPVLALDYIEVSSQTQSMIESRSGNSFSGAYWETHSETLNDNVASAHVKIPSAKSSMKTIINAWYDKDLRADKKTANGAHSKSYTARHNPALNEYHYNFNGTVVPELGIRNLQDSDASVTAAAESMRAMHYLLANNSVAFKRGKYDVNPAGSTAADREDGSNTFLIAVSPEATGKSGQTMSGTSTLANQPSLDLKFKPAIPEQCELESYVHFDVNFTIENGIVKLSQ